MSQGKFWYLLYGLGSALGAIQLGCVYVAVQCCVTHPLSRRQLPSLARLSHPPFWLYEGVPRGFFIPITQRPSTFDSLRSAHGRLSFGRDWRRPGR